MTTADSSTETASPPRAAPVRAGERIAALDVLRGFAVLGILAMNVQSYSMIEAAYLNPAANDWIDGAGYWAWLVAHVFFDMKFISIFSALFGAGMALMAERAAARGASATGVHYRRQFWLLLIGLAHAHLIWYGDILVPYALCGFLLYSLRNLSPTKLLIGGFAMTAVPAVFFLLTGLSIPFIPAEDQAQLAGDWAPAAAAIEAEIATYRGSWLTQLPHRSATALGAETFVFLVLFFWRSGGLMLVGMGLYKLGVFSARRSPAFYRRLLAVSFGAGLPIVILGVVFNTRHGFAFEHSMFQGMVFNLVGATIVFLGYVALVMLAVLHGWLPGLQRRLQAAGRMALSNYISQSVICTLIFYGHGLGQFEQVSRLGQFGIVIAIWAAQLAWSPWWLARFRFGPLEWLWRSLTYMKFQPMAVRSPA
ncbi:MAG: DUF418 domain-containing protein [Holophagales bacterium]|nr:DUF418 domain-containing protein [Holophagales bacterium]MYD23576.1 DUF418 domain-containing protein [Holophagales bacterium]MYI31356.1 DUF418 domain-containing protein [Holophagales bacterium]